MDKKYEELICVLGKTIEHVVNELLAYKSEGQLVSANFNGVTLYSDTVTMDSAYQSITGKTKVEFDKEREKQLQEYEQQQKEHIAKIPELTEFWKRKGREILDSDKWDYWDKIIPIRLNDLYQGKELEASLEIIKILNNNGTFNEAKIAFENQGHSGMSSSLVTQMIKEFSLRGDKFVKDLNNQI